jgi:RHH-type proline utilization regulon transcriptional repressor/proline dehydrogenase/delta 1-pyrroline-5-carboxylate dehydrogenase
LQERGTGGEVFTNEPETDFADPDNQDRMQEALVRVREQLPFAVPIVISQHARAWFSDPRPARTPATRRGWPRAFTSPPPNRPSARSGRDTAFPRWRDTPVEERADLLRRVADEFARRRFEIAAWQVVEVGKPWREADADVAEAIDFCRFYASEMERLASPVGATCRASGTRCSMTRAAPPS